MKTKKYSKFDKKRKFVKISLCFDVQFVSREFQSSIIDQISYPQTFLSLVTNSKTFRIPVKMHEKAE